jgi:hypothetical protein
MKCLFIENRLTACKRFSKYPLYDSLRKKIYQIALLEESFSIYTLDKYVIYIFIDQQLIPYSVVPVHICLLHWLGVKGVGSFGILRKKNYFVKFCRKSYKNGRISFPNIYFISELKFLLSLLFQFRRF